MGVERWDGRPYGTSSVSAVNPALKRWARERKQGCGFVREEQAAFRGLGVCEMRVTFLSVMNVLVCDEIEAWNDHVLFLLSYATCPRPSFTFIWKVRSIR